MSICFRIHFRSAILSDLLRLQTVQEKRKRIQAELAAAIPPDAHEDRDDEADENADLM